METTIFIIWLIFVYAIITEIKSNPPTAIAELLIIISQPKLRSSSSISSALEVSGIVFAVSLIRLLYHISSCLSSKRRRY